MFLIVIIVTRVGALGFLAWGETSDFVLSTVLRTETGKKGLTRDTVFCSGEKIVLSRSGTGYGRIVHSQEKKTVIY